jgi:hypothetical protein
LFINSASPSSSKDCWRWNAVIVICDGVSCLWGSLISWGYSTSVRRSKLYSFLKNNRALSWSANLEVHIYLSAKILGLMPSVSKISFCRSCYSTLVRLSLKKQRHAA